MDWEGGPKRGAFDEDFVGIGANRKTEVFGWGFLDRVEQEGTGAGGGGGSGAGGGWVEWEGGPKHGPFGAVHGSFCLGSWTVWSRMGGGSGGGREWGRGGWVEWEGGQGGAGRGGEWGGGSGPGGVGWSGSQARSFWWDLVGMRVGFEPPKTEKQKFVVGVSGQGGAGKAGSGGEAGVALGGGWVGGMRGSSCGH